MKTKIYKSDVMDVADKGIVTIAVSSFNNVDLLGDIVRKGAFEKTFKEGSQRIKHVLDHSLRSTSVVGLPIKMYESDTHAIVESKLNLEKEAGRDLFSDYKFFQANGKSLEHSFGYDTIKSNKIKGTRTASAEEILELKMYEYSTVSVGANPNALTLSIKSFDEDDIPMLEDYLRKYDVSNSKGKQIESIILQIKELKEPVKTTPDDEPALPLAAQLNELLKTQKIFV